MNYTAAASLQKPAGTESFSRSIMNQNSDKIDKQLLSLAVSGALFATFSFGTMTFDGSGNPASQSFTGPGGISGSTVWSFSASQITTTYSFTAPISFSVTIKTNLTNLSRTVEVI